MIILQHTKVLQIKKQGKLNECGNEIKNGESVEVSVDITNSGRVNGDEIVQLYIRDKV